MPIYRPSTFLKKGCLHEYPLGACSPSITARRDSYSHHASAAKFYRRSLLDRHRTDWTLRRRQFSLLITKWEKAVANRDHLSRLKFASAMPYAFTEHGALMAASVLNSPRAVEVNAGGRSGSTRASASSLLRGLGHSRG